MAKLSDKKMLLVVVGVAVGLSALGAGGVWWGKGLVHDKQESIAQMRAEIAVADAKIRKIGRVEQDVIILRENLNEYVKILPEQSEVNGFLRVTNQFLGQSGVVMTKFVPGTPRSDQSPFEQYTYKFEIRATLWQFMQFVSLFEGYARFVQLKDFVLTSQSHGEQDPEQVVHKITMTVETYVYRASAKSTDVQIANYSHKMERLRDEIFEARQTIVTKGYRFQGARGRRDIFLDPRETSAGPGRSIGPSAKDQRELIDRLRGMIAECQDIFGRLQDKSIAIFDRYTLERRLRQEIAKVAEEVDRANQDNHISHAPLKLIWNREVLEPLDGLRQLAEDVVHGERDQWLPEIAMKNLLERMGDDLVNGDTVGAIQRYSMVENQLAVERSDPRFPLYVKIEGLYLRAKLAEEFRALMLDISGICVNDDGKSGVILNDTVYEEGEYVDSGLLIKVVQRDRVEFVYKGFTVVKTL